MMIRWIIRNILSVILTDMVSWTNTNPNILNKIIEKTNYTLDMLWQHLLSEYLLTPLRPYMSNTDAQFNMMMIMKLCTMPETDYDLRVIMYSVHDMHHTLCSIIGSMTQLTRYTSGSIW